MRQQSPVNDPAVIRHEYATEERFLARRLATWAELAGPLVEDAAIAAVDEDRPTHVLDAGCGTGDFSERLRRELGVPLVALDTSPRMVTLARERGLDAICGDIQALPFPDASFNCVLANRVLYHLPDLDQGLAEIARVLIPGGKLVAVTYGVDHTRELYDLVGTYPLASSPFSSENGEESLRRRFAFVERRDFSGVARFPDRNAVRGLLVASWGDAFAHLDFAGRLARVPEPFVTTYQHSIFVARNVRSA
jgi:SAM-dependent methyltransferase